MRVTCLEVGSIGACCYIVGPDKAEGGVSPCVVVDPGGEADRITGAVRARGLCVDTIFLTHAHADHIAGVADLLRDWPDAALACSAETSRRAGDPRLNLSVYIGGPVTSPPATRILADGERFDAAGMHWQAVEIPGHDPGEMVYILEGEGVVFTGDVLFAGSIGRSDFPGGDGRALVAGVLRLLEGLSPATVIYPGHGPATRAGRELSTNPFLRPA